MKKQTWMLFSVLALASVVSSLPAHAGRDPDLAVSRKMREAEAAEYHAARAARPTPILRQVIDEYTAGRLAGLSDATELTTAEMCETAPSVGAMIRSGAVKAISEEASSANLRQFKKGYDRGYADGREYTAFNARKDVDFCKN